MKTPSTRRLWPAVLLLVLGLLLLGACSAKDKTMTLGITGYNYTGDGVQEYYVNESRGSNLSIFSGGGSTSCCVSLPAHWKPEVNVKIEANIIHYTQPWKEQMPWEQFKACCLARRIFEKTVPVQPYKDNAGGVVQVFFLPDDQIEVWVSPLSVLHPDHPSKRGYPKNLNPATESQ
ncbi:MAG: DUF3304 domain-containing protein [Bordetella sp.]|nr:DUF3304 domain-containing protein [Bordetella sp.]